MHNPEIPENTLSNVLLALKGHEGRSVTGARLHEIIKRAAPDLNIRSVVGIHTGPGALTKFINTYLHQTVNRIGMQGGDVLYGIGDDVIPSPRMTNANIWKAFVSPNAVYHLCLNMFDMRLIAAETLDDNVDGIHHIGRMTEDEHAAIRQEFLSSLSESQRALIDEQTEQNPSYDAFVQALRSNSLNSLWGKFRRDSIKRLFIIRLENIPVAKNVIPGVLNQLMTSQTALFQSNEKKSLPAPLPSTSRSPEDLTPSGGSDLDSARSFVRSIINHMGHDEIRAINLPFGAVLDALNARR